MLTFIKAVNGYYANQKSSDKMDTA